MRSLLLASSLLLLLLPGCKGAAEAATGWANLDVAPAPLAAGWTRMGDAGSGISFDVPAGWTDYKPMDEAFQQRALQAMKTAGGLPAGGAIRMGTIGSVPDLAAISLLPDDLKRGLGILVEARQNHAPRRITLDRAVRALDQTGWGQPPGTPGAMEAGRVQLPVGPAYRRVAPYNANRTDCRLITYLFLHEKDVYTVAFRVPAADMARLKPTMDAIVASIRLKAPDQAAKDAKREAALEEMRRPKPTKPVFETGPIEAPVPPDPYGSAGGAPNPGLRPGGGDAPVQSPNEAPGAAGDPNSSPSQGAATEGPVPDGNGGGAAGDPGAAPPPTTG